MAWWVRVKVKSVYSDTVEVIEPHRAVWQAGEKLHNEQGEARRARADGALFLYYGNARHGLRGSPLAEMLWPTDPPFLNGIGMCVDTKTAHVFRNQVRTYFITENGKVSERERAEGMTQAVEAQFEAGGLFGYPGFLMCQDGQLFDGGVTKIITDVQNNRVLTERVFPWEIYVPLEESRTGNPRQFFHRMLVDRSALAGMFPDHFDEIAKATSAPDDWMMTEGFSEHTSDLVAVYEAWHLPSVALDLSKKKVWGKNDENEFDPDIDPGHDGRHVIAMENVTLLDEPWVYDHPPLAFYLPQPDPMGAWSLSLPEQLAGGQLELIKLGKRIQMCIHLHAVPRLVVWRDAKINANKLSNGLADILETTRPVNQSVTYLTPQAVPSELFRREQDVLQSMMQRAGISELSAYAQKPKGVEAAVAMQHLADTESIRHTPSFRGWERHRVQCGIAIVDAYRELAERNPKFTVMFGDAEHLKEIKWTDVDLGRGKYKYRAWPTALLPSMPAAKAERVMSFLSGGLLADNPDAERARALLTDLDFKAHFPNANAIEKNVQELLNKVEEHGMSVDTMPEPYNDPKLCMRLAAERINDLQSRGVEESRIEGLRNFWETARRVDLRMQPEQVQATAGIAPGQPGPATPPPGAPPAELPAPVAAA